MLDHKTLFWISFRMGCGLLVGAYVPEESHCTTDVFLWFVVSLNEWFGRVSFRLQLLVGGLFPRESFLDVL